MQLDNIKQSPKDSDQWNFLQSLLPHLKCDTLATADTPHSQNILEYRKRQARQVSILVLKQPGDQFLENQSKRSNLKINSGENDNPLKLVPIPSTKADQCQKIDNSYEKLLVGAANLEQPKIKYSNDSNSSENDSVQKCKNIEQLNEFKDSPKNIKLLSRNLYESSKIQKNRQAVKEKKIYKNNHPTKNFLASFKMAHIYYLQKSLGKEKVHSFSDIKRLEKQNGITKKDFVDLYSIPEFESTFERMFYTKQLFRNLMLSKSRIQHRKVHQKKLFNFEKAFKTKQFLRIE